MMNLIPILFFGAAGLLSREVLVLGELLIQEDPLPPIECPKQDVNLRMVGEAGDLMRAAVDFYSTHCPNKVQIQWEASTADSALRQLCNHFLVDEELAADVAIVQRQWITDTQDENNFEVVFDESEQFYDCRGSRREAIQVVAAYKSLVVLAGDDALKCLSSIDTDHLRWMTSDESYENIMQSQLKVIPIVPGIDANNRTWSNTFGCTTATSDLKIVVAAPLENSQTMQWIDEIILQGDNFVLSRLATTSSVEDVVAFVKENPNSIGIMSFEDYRPYRFQASLFPLVSTLSRIEPTVESTVRHSPLTRPIYWNILDNDGTLNAFNPLLELVFSVEGDALVQSVGYTPVWEIEKLKARVQLQSQFAPDVTAYKCPEQGLDSLAEGTLRVVGPPYIQPILERWAAIYPMVCPHPKISFDFYPQTADVAIQAICDLSVGSEIQNTAIATVGREIYPSEAFTKNGWEYNCAGNQDRLLISVDVALDAVSFVVAKGGLGAACLAALGHTLSMDQLRWIFSNFSEDLLMATGWNIDAAIPNSDGNSATHLWSELLDHPNCPSSEILIAGAGKGSGSFEYLSKELFNEEMGETFAIDRNESRPGYLYFASLYEEEILAYLQDHTDAIGFVGYHSLRQMYARLQPIAVQNRDGSVFFPLDDTINFGEYALTRSLAILLVNQTEIMELGRLFFEFGTSEQGQLLVDDARNPRLPGWRTKVMQTRLQTLSGVPIKNIRQSSHIGCAQSGFRIGGSSTVRPVAELWAGIYEIGCDVSIPVQGGGTHEGAGRVCANLEKGEPTEIGNMSRDWKSSEAVPVANKAGVFQCVKGDTSRTAIQTQVAIDGLAVVTLRGGVAAECIEIMGGLTVQQLRWIYTNLSEEQLKDDPNWDRNAVPNSDQNDFTHSWSELHRDCARTEILISGADSASGTYDYFSEVIFTAEGETFGLNRPAPYVNNEFDEVLVQYVLENPAAISYFGYSYYFTKKDILEVVPIANSEGKMVIPTADTVADESYNPFSRPIYMNILNEKDVIENALPFIQFGFSDYGAKLVELTGYVPISDTKSFQQINRIATVHGNIPLLEGGPTYPPTTPPTPRTTSLADEDKLSDALLIVLVLGSVVLVSVCIILSKRNCYSPAKEDTPEQVV